MIKDLILAMAVIVLTGLVFSKISKKLKVPNVTGYLIGGLLIGPYLFALIFPNASGILSAEAVSKLKIISSIELGFIAFGVGAEFKMSYFKEVGIRPVLMAFMESLFAIVVIFVALILFGYPVPFSLTLAAIGSATAPAATISVIKQYKAKGPLTNTLLSVVAIDDASALIFFGFAITIVKAVENIGGSILLSILMPFIEIILSVSLGAILGFILTWFCKIFTGRGNRLCSVIVFSFLGIGLTTLINEYFGINVSSLLVCMCIGAIFTNFSTHVDEVVPLVDRFTPPFIIMFFVLSGADLELGSISLAIILPIIIYVVCRSVGKFVGVLISGKVTKASKEMSNLLSLGLMPQGGVALGLSLIALDVLPETGDYTGNMVRAIILCSCFITELFGPLMTKYMLYKAHEATVPLPEKKVKALVINKK